MGKMSSGMRMMAMARAQSGNQGNYSRMGDGGQMGTQMTMGNVTEMRRQRDSRGRYMENDGETHMGGNYEQTEGNYGRYRPWTDPHTPPYLNKQEMRGERNVQPGRERRSSVELEYEPVHMRDKNIVHIRDYQDKRRIGFGENRMHHDSRLKREDNEDDEMMEGDAHHMGAYPMMDQLTQEIATKWVDGMKNSDPEHPEGAKWSRETTKALAIKHGFNTPESQLEFWAVMNMMYSDYAETAKKHNVSTMDFYADMAKAWIRDKDGVKHKTAAYITCCTE